ncbi:hypothetical protein [Thermosulfurimonas dismutans]|uniref:Uncharacterized protein n=1 Tax=Thermosulfurimonas dismutans TaxID=999894 RepID=A0A179D3C4_9BACT|nr:hypothetical protein [Thermosulfurimonas dismutans]OAQ20546.1 hypothetical protein TDIS_1315 [Thermosulfurimonas dismutans]
MDERKINSEIICQKIHEVYPDIGACGIEVKVDWDENVGHWVVYLEKGEKTLKTYLEPEEIEACLAGKQCVSLGIQIGQLKQYHGLL